MNTNELTDKELLSYLQELQQQEEQELPDEYKNGESWQFVHKDNSLVPASKNEADAARKKASAIIHEKAVDKKRRKQEIINEAINSTFIDLNSPLTVEHKKLLISILTQQYTDCMKKHESYINNTIEKLLRMLMPRDLLNTWAKYKDTMVPLPAFTYKASKEYGQELSFKVTLDLPYYFRPEVCVDILKEHFSKQLPTIDKSVAFFYKHKETRTKQEVKIAQQLTQITSFFQLVKKNAFWYEALINKLKEQPQ